MKKINFLLIFLIAIIGISCDQDKETEVPEPAGIFFRATIDGATKTLTEGVNGYVVQYYDTCYPIDTFNYYEPSMKLSQESQNYYVSSKEAISFTFKNLFAFHDSIINKDSILGVYLDKHRVIPFYSYTYADNLTKGGLNIIWRDANGKEWESGLGTQTSTVSVDTLLIVRKPGMTSEYKLYITFDCKLYAVGTTAYKEIKDGHARISIRNTCFY